MASHALKGQKLLAQGNTLGKAAGGNAPCKGKSFIITRYLKLLPLQGVYYNGVITQGDALGWELLPFQGVWLTEASVICFTCFRHLLYLLPSFYITCFLLSCSRFSSSPLSSS